MLVRRVDAVTWIAGFVYLHEEFLRVPIETTFTRLIGSDLDESVVTAFFLHAQLERAQVSRERSRFGGVTRTIDSDFGKEIIADLQYFDWGELSSEKMAHVRGQVPGSLAG